MDEKQLAGIIQLIGLAELLVSSSIVPGLKNFFVRELKLTAEQETLLDLGYEELQEVKKKITARREEIKKET